MNSCRSPGLPPLQALHLTLAPPPGPKLTQRAEELAQLQGGSGQGLKCRLIYPEHDPPASTPCAPHSTPAADSKQPHATHTSHCTHPPISLPAATTTNAAAPFGASPPDPFPLPNPHTHTIPPQPSPAQATSHQHTDNDPSPPQVTAPSPVHATGEAAALSHQPPVITLAESAGLRFRLVGCGGTFDRLHAGHMLLLATAALVSSEELFIGITDDVLLANKVHRGLIQEYRQREQGVREYVEAVHPGLSVRVGPLTDPKAPTPAELEENMQALVASEETLAGALGVNEGRRRRGFKPLTIILVPVIGLTESGSKLSSTDLRCKEAEAHGTQH